MANPVPRDCTAARRKMGKPGMLGESEVAQLRAILDRYSAGSVLDAIANDCFERGRTGDGRAIQGAARNVL